MRLNRTLSVIVAAGVLVGGANLAVNAANGKPFLLGRVNKESKPAVLKNTGAGTALKFKVNPAAPPFKVNSTKKVGKLNADRLDGLDSTALSSVTTLLVDESPGNKGALNSWTVPVGAGAYSISFSAALNPTVGSEADPTTVACGFFDNGEYRAMDEYLYTGSFGQAFVSGVDTINSAAPHNLSFFCQTTNASTYSLQPGAGIRISVTKLTGINEGVLQDPSPRALHERGAGSGAGSLR